MNEIKSASIRKRQHSRRNVLAVAVVLIESGLFHIVEIVLPKMNQERVNENPSTAGYHLVDGGEDVSAS